jgi:hypothetical protein
VSWVGLRRIAAPHAAHTCHRGASKYSLVRMRAFDAGRAHVLRLAPLYLATFLGFTVSICSFHCMLLIFCWLFSNLTVPG